MSLTALILAAGYATRMYPLTEHRPKALLPLAGRLLPDDLVDVLCGLPRLGEL